MLSITHNFHSEAYSGVSPVKIGFFFKEIIFCRQLPQRNFGVFHLCDNVVACFQYIAISINSMHLYKTLSVQFCFHMKGDNKTASCND